MKKAMQTVLGDGDDVRKLLSKSGFTRQRAARAVEIAQQKQSRFTVFSVVDALTQLAGERTDDDQKASKLLALAV
jgi:endonuclease III